MIMENLKKIFEEDIQFKDNLLIIENQSVFENQQQTNEAFSEKWLKYDTNKTIKGIESFQQRWYLDLYGFESEDTLQSFLQTKPLILDAGCGLGYKAAWFAQLAPESTIIGIDFSDAAIEASYYYKDLKNLFFIKGDIANTRIQSESIDYVSCDQVIHHTENPEQTFAHLSSILKSSGQFACYVYAKKSLPRELIDEYFRTYSKKLTKDQLWKLSEQLTQLGKTLSDLNIKINVPDIPALDIKGGEYDIQRFIYWNFIKCFWNEEFGWDNSVSTNFDWYAPSNAQRYTEEEFKKWSYNNNLSIEYFHKEEACYSGRFIKE